jgi:hypothetical protein
MGNYHSNSRILRAVALHDCISIIAGVKYLSRVDNSGGEMYFYFYEELKKISADEMEKAFAKSISEMAKYEYAGEIGSITHGDGIWPKAEVNLKISKKHDTGLFGKQGEGDGR